MVPKLHYKSFNELKDTCLHLIKELKQEDIIIIKKSIPKIEFTNGGSSTHYIESVDVLETIRFNLSKKIEKLDKDKLLKLFDVEFPYFFNHPIRYNGEQRQHTIQYLIEILLANVIQKSPDLIKPDKILSEDLFSLEHILTEKKIDGKLIVPIGNLNIDDFKSDYKIDDGIKFIKLSNRFIETRINHSSPFYMYPRFAIEIDYSVDLILKNDPLWSNPLYQSRIDFDKIIRKIIFSINLISPGGVYTPMKYEENFGFAKNWIPGGASGSIYTIPFGNQCNMTVNQIDLVVNVYKKIKRNNFTQFEMPVKRLNEAELRINAYDSIIDSVIALEYLLLNDIGNEKERGEMRFRFALNYTTLFKEGKINKRKFALDVYNLRSTIVHGATPMDKIPLGSGNVTLTQAALDIRNMLRDTIIYLLALPENNNFYTSGFWLNRIFN